MGWSTHTPVPIDQAPEKVRSVKAFRAGVTIISAPAPAITARITVCVSSPCCNMFIHERVSFLLLCVGTISVGANADITA